MARKYLDQRKKMHFVKIDVFCCDNFNENIAKLVIDNAEKL